MKIYFTFNTYVTIRENNISYIFTGGKRDLIFDKQKINQLFDFFDNYYFFLKNEKKINSRIIKQLLKENYIIPGKHEKVIKYSRLQNFYKYLEVDYDLSIIGDKKIIVLGAGGGGGTLIYSLAQSGFKNINCIDFDVVEKSDVEKSFIYRKIDIGKLKTHVLKDLLSLNFETDFTYHDLHIHDYSVLEQIIIEYKPDLIVNAIDPNPNHKILLNNLANQHKIPLFFLAYSYENILLGPFLNFKNKICFKSYFNYVRKQTNANIDFSEIRSVNFFKSIHPSTSFNINILSSFALKDIHLFFSNKTSLMLSLNSLVILNTMNLTGSQLELNCSDNCDCIN